jgi:hypothetical protein
MKKKSIRKHEVWADFNNIELVRAKSSLRLMVWARGEKLGELEVGQGSFFWWGHRRKKSKRLNWSKFAAKMNELAYEQSQD